ncbi:unnamed protein product [Closterium sp. NIES-53]
MLQLHLRRLFVGWFLLIFIYGTGAGGAGAASLGGARVPTGAGGTGGAGAAGPGGARTRGTGAAGAGGVGGAGAGGAGAGDPGAGGVGTGGTGAGGAWAGGAGAGDPGARGTGAGGTVQRRPFFVPSPPLSLPPLDSILRQVLSFPSSTGLPPSLLSPPPRQSQPQLQPNSPLPTPSPYAKETDSFTERCEPESRPASPVRAVRTGLPLPPPLESSLPAIPDPESDLARAASPTVSRLLATVDTDPSFESTAASALVAELVDLAGAYRLDYATSLVAESESGCPPSVGGECALGTDVLEDRQKEGSRYQCNLHYTDYKGEI